MVMSKQVGQDRVPPGLLQQIASVQQTATQSGILSNTPMWYDGSYLNATAPQIELGSTWNDGFAGNWYRSVKATSALTPGQLCSIPNPTAGTVTAAGSTVQAIVTNITTTVNEAGNYIWFLDAVGVYSAGATPFKQSLRLIKSSTVGSNAVFTVSQRGSIYGNNAFDPDALPSVPANGSACRIIRPFNVETASTTKAPTGVALGEVTSGNYTIVQVAGLAMVQTDGTTATVLGSPGQVLANGIFSGMSATYASTGIPGAASILPLYAHASATVTLTPCMVNFLGA